jgi:hypothetical protein
MFREFLSTARTKCHAEMTASSASSVSVVVPTFGNAPALETLTAEISQTLERENRKFEIIQGTTEARRHLEHDSENPSIVSDVEESI